MSKPPSDGRVLFAGSRFDVVELTQIVPDGATLTRQAVIHPGAVVILPLLSEDRVCLIRNVRPAVGKTLTELPAGTLDHDEPLRATAKRELREETGYTAQQWRQLPSFFMSPGILNERMHVFVAEDLAAGPPAREEGEEIENLVVTWAEAMEMVDGGQIEDAKTLCTLLMWDRIRRNKS